MKRIFLIGIGGIGMSALARYFKALGGGHAEGEIWAVSGSDAAAGPITEGLKKDGISVKIGHKKANLSSQRGRRPDLVVYNRAIPPENPELKAARAMGIRTLPYAEVLGEITEQYETIAITGSHGKSTTTALATIILMKADLNPTVMVGTNLRELGGKNFRKGGSHLVLEADDFGGAFTHYTPTIAVVTNIDREHLDYYRTFARLKKAFVDFLENVRPGGALILNRDDKNLWSLRRAVAAIEKRKGVRVIWHSNRGTTAAKIRRVIKIPGEHNVADAIAAYKVGRVLGIPHRTIQRAIGTYRGAWRRMEYRGRFFGAPVYDDYAHHPTEIRATLQAFRARYPEKEILCVFQPHLARRLEALFKEFMTAFDGADQTLLLPIYKVAGRHTAPQAGRSDAAALVRAIQKKQPQKPIFYVADPRNLPEAIEALSRMGGSSPLSRKVIVMMGAGDIVALTDSLLAAKKRI